MWRYQNRFLLFTPVSMKNFQLWSMWMTLNHQKTNFAKFVLYRPKIQKVIEFFEFQSLTQHPLYVTVYCSRANVNSILKWVIVTTQIPYQQSAWPCRILMLTVYWFINCKTLVPGSSSLNICNCKNSCADSISLFSAAVHWHQLHSEMLTVFCSLLAAVHMISLHW